LSGKTTLEKRSNLVGLAKTNKRGKPMIDTNGSKKRKNSPAKIRLLVQREVSNHFPKCYGIYLEIIRAGFIRLDHTDE